MFSDEKCFLWHVEAKIFHLKSNANVFTSRFQLTLVEITTAFKIMAKLQKKSKVSGGQRHIWPQQEMNQQTEQWRRQKIDLFSLDDRR